MCLFSIIDTILLLLLIRVFFFCITDSSLKIVNEKINDGIIDILTPKELITIDGQRLELVVAHFNYWDIESAASEVVDKLGLFFMHSEVINLFADTESGCYWLRQKLNAV